MSAYMDRVRNIVDEYGVMIQGVFPREGDADPAFAYTVGMSSTAYLHPEFIVFSLTQEVFMDVLNGLAERVFTGEVFAAGLYTDILNVPCHLVEVQDTTKWMPIAGELFPVVRGLQLVWPDDAGHFPWDADYSVSPAAQPVLGTRPEESS